MSEITGVVQEIKARSVAGGRTSYDIVVAGQSYGAGLFAPKCKEGDYIKFDLDESRGYKNVGRNSLKVSKGKAPPEAVAEAAATKPTKTSTGGSIDTKQDTISRQSANNTAVAFLAVLTANDALGLPATAKGKKQEAIELMLKAYAKQFYESNTGAVWKDIAPSAKQPEAAPEEEEEVAAVDDSEWQ